MTEVSGPISCHRCCWLLGCISPSLNLQNQMLGDSRQGPQTFSLCADLSHRCARIRGDPDSIINYVYYLNFAWPLKLISRSTTALYMSSTSRLACPRPGPGNTKTNHTRPLSKVGGSVASHRACHCCHQDTTGSDV